METTDVTIPVLRVMAIVRNSPSWEALIKNLPIEPGQIIPVTKQELQSFHEDCLILDVLPNEKGK